MSDRLELVEAAGARALVAPGFSRALDELGVLDPEVWRARLGKAGPRGSATAVELAGGRQLVLRCFRHGGALGTLLGRGLWSPRRLFEELSVTHTLCWSTSRYPVATCTANTRLNRSKS